MLENDQLIWMNKAGKSWKLEIKNGELWKSDDECFDAEVNTDYLFGLKIFLRCSFTKDVL